MPSDRVNEIKTKLDSLQDISEREYNDLTKLFNQFKDKHNPNFPTPTLSFSKYFYLLNLCYEDFKILSRMLDSSKDTETRSALNRILIGWFYEMVTAIRRNDMFRYYVVGFNLTEEEIKTLEGYRNTIFHIPENEELFVDRARKFIRWDTVVKRNLENSTALNRYIYLIKRDYFQIVNDEISKWTVRI